MPPAKQFSSYLQIPIETTVRLDLTLLAAALNHRTAASLGREAIYNLLADPANQAILARAKGQTIATSNSTSTKTITIHEAADVISGKEK